MKRGGIVKVPALGFPILAGRRKRVLSGPKQVYFEQIRVAVQQPLLLDDTYSSRPLPAVLFAGLSSSTTATTRSSPSVRISISRSRVVSKATCKGRSARDEVMPVCGAVRVGPRPFIRHATRAGNKYIGAYLRTCDSGPRRTHI